ncbi:MAG: TonB family protein [Desulfurobacteriaceae bacterium]
MKASVRIVLALLVSILIELAFIRVTEIIYKPQPKEVKEVIKISLIKPKNQKVKIEKTLGKRTKKKKKKKIHSKSTPKKPKIVSKRTVKKIPKETSKEKSSGGLKAVDGNLPAYYLEAIRRAIEENIFYPLEAIERGEEGRVSVEFVLNRNGKVLQCKPLRGKSEILKEATCIAIGRATFPPIPTSIKNSKLKFQLEIEYNLDMIR